MVWRVRPAADRPNRFITEMKSMKRVRPIGAVNCRSATASFIMVATDRLGDVCYTCRRSAAMRSQCDFLAVRFSSSVNFFGYLASYRNSAISCLSAKRNHIPCTQWHPQVSANADGPARRAASTTLCCAPCCTQRWTLRVICLLYTSDVADE